MDAAFTCLLTDSNWDVGFEAKIEERRSTIHPNASVIFLAAMSSQHTISGLMYPNHVSCASSSGLECTAGPIRPVVKSGSEIRLQRTRFLLQKCCPGRRKAVKRCKRCRHPRALKTLSHRMNSRHFDQADVRDRIREQGRDVGLRVHLYRARHRRLRRGLKLRDLRKEHVLRHRGRVLRPRGRIDGEGEHGLSLRSGTPHTHREGSSGDWTKEEHDEEVR